MTGTLFEATAGEPATPASDAIHPEDACWLEVKVVAQYSVESGVPGPNRAYGSHLTRSAVTDVGKLSADRTIIHGALVLLLFTADEATASHDAAILLDRLLTRGMRVTSPVIRTVPILDRIGNARCSVVLVPLRPAPPIDD